VRLAALNLSEISGDSGVDPGILRFRVFHLNSRVLISA